MRIAFYAPLKAPDDPTPSGDRQMARLLIAALGAAGHDVALASRFRSFDATGDAARQARLRALGLRLTRRLVRRYRTEPSAGRPNLWFTYHLYHKAPDWLGPDVSRALGIPYVVAEASHAPKQETGPWALGWRAAKAAIMHADLVVGLNPADAPCVRPLLAAPTRALPLKPFTDVTRLRRLAADTRAPSQAAAVHDHDGEEPVLLTVAMMRAGDKLASYRLLASALGAITHRRWRLLVVGDGPARSEVMAAMAPLGQRVTFLAAARRPPFFTSMPPPTFTSGRPSAKLTAWQCWKRTPWACRWWPARRVGSVQSSATSKRAFSSRQGTRHYSPTPSPRCSTMPTGAARWRPPPHASWPASMTSPAPPKR